MGPGGADRRGAGIPASWGRRVFEIAEVEPRCAVLFLVVDNKLPTKV